MVVKKKTKTKPKSKNKQTQKQSQNVIVNIHESKKKPTIRRRNNNNQQKNNNSSFVYAIPDNRAIDTLRGDLVDTKNKLLSIQNTKNLVNNNSNVNDTKYYSRDDNIGDWKDIKRFKDEKKKEEDKQKKQNLNNDIISHSKIFQLKNELKKERKEKFNQVRENVNSAITIQNLTDQIDTDRKQFNEYIDDIENDYKRQQQRQQQQEKDRYGMRDNDINVKERFTNMTPEQKARYHIEKKQIRKIKKRIGEQKAQESEIEPDEMYNLFETNYEKAGNFI